MAKLLHIERLGGFGGFGGPKSHLKSMGTIDLESLPGHVQAAVEGLFKSPEPTTPDSMDGFRYRLTQTADNGEQHSIEVSEAAVPPSIAGAVKDELV